MLLNNDTAAVPAYQSDIYCKLCSDFEHNILIVHTIGGCPKQKKEYFITCPKCNAPLNIQIGP